MRFMEVVNSYCIQGGLFGRRNIFQYKQVDNFNHAIAICMHCFKRSGVAGLPVASCERRQSSGVANILCAAYLPHLKSREIMMSSVWRIQQIVRKGTP